MKRALLLAAKGEGKVSPNPLVGAVLVKKGKIIGEGWHEGFGKAHAEANAISLARRRGHGISGTTLYVSLEPCSHSGKGKKMPPCVPLIVRAGISRVVIAADDPNPKVSGTAQLRKAGIRVDAGLLAKEAQEQNEPFFKFMQTGRPFVLVKMAQSANGKIGIRGKKNIRISGKKFNRHSHLLRNQFDSILVGINTVLADNPRLTCRIPGGRNPARIILDSRLRIPLSAKALCNAKKERVIIATSERADAGKAASLRKLGAVILFCGKKDAELPKLLGKLPNFGIISVLIEGGATTARSALSQRLVDKACVAVSKRKIISAQAAVDSPFSKKLLKTFKKKDFGSDTLHQKHFGVRR